MCTGQAPTGRATSSSFGTRAWSTAAGGARRSGSNSGAKSLTLLVAARTPKAMGYRWWAGRAIWSCGTGGCNTQARSTEMTSPDWQSLAASGTWPCECPSTRAASQMPEKSSNLPCAHCRETSGPPVFYDEEAVPRVQSTPAARLRVFKGHHRQPPGLNELRCCSPPPAPSPAAPLLHRCHLNAARCLPQVCGAVHG